ncbi:ArnT family glycosyltransferase [Kallotenue papyrolyticum]|uniref:ArnT family glycosyltransferase n=1 Tax=Kallotenue papyrolyticum TaxID=1325125 RepID=UPI0004785542|nr:glycosyltransferase family 39 protein [Kallotenue papyrolyticum]
MIDGGTGSQRRASIWRRVAAHWGLAPALALFLALALPGLAQPGLHYDEALEGGLPAVQILYGGAMTPLNGVALTIGGRTLPLMVQNHIGALQAYLAVPFVALGGATATSLRLMTVAGGLITLVAVYTLAAQLYGRLAAGYAALWLATFASFVFWTRQGVFVTSLALCFAMCALALGVAWWRTRRAWLAACAGLCMGLAVYAKLNALWLLNGVLLWLALWAGATWLRRRPGQTMQPAGRRRRGTSALPLAFLGFGAGVWPLIAYNLLSGGATLRTVEQSAAAGTYLGVDNAQIAQNLRTRLAQVADVLRSGDHLWYLGGVFPSRLAVGAVLLALIVTLLIGLRRRSARLLFVPWLGLMVIAQSCFTISALWPTHFAIATPLPALLLGIALSQLAAALRRRRRGRLRRAGLALLGAFGVALLADQSLSSMRYLRAVLTTGGESFHSAAIYDLNAALAAHREPIIALDWGIAAQLAYFSGGQRSVEELYGYEPSASDAFRAALRARFGAPYLYITHAERQEAFPRRAAFLETVAAAGYWAERVATIPDARGVPIFEVWRVRLPGS